MKLSFLPVIILLLVLGCVDLVSSDLVCLNEGAFCGGGEFSCCEKKGLTCIEGSAGIEQCRWPGHWKTITHDTFDNGWGSFKEHYKPENTKRTDDGRYVYKGVHALRMKRKTSIKYKDYHDVSNYEKLRIEMWTYAKNLEHDDYLKLFLNEDGEEHHKYTFDLKNDQFRKVTFTTKIEDVDKIKILLELEASKGDEKVFIDELRVQGFKKSDEWTTWYNITYDNFEGGWGSFAQVGNDVAADKKDAVRVSNSSSNQQYFVPEGNAALRIRDDSGKESSVFHKDGHNVTGYSRCRVSFQFSAKKVDQDDGFVLQYSSNNGTDWTKVKEYIKKSKEDPEDGGKFYFRNVAKNGKKWNHRFYSDTAVLKGEDYNLDTTNARIRFLSKASGDNSFIYIDDMKFECRY